MIPPRPWNPRNGHSWKCKCTDCLIFWDSALGAQVYADWRKRIR